MKIRTLIVDDEYPARQELRYLLSNNNDIEIVGEAVTATEAMKLICALEYDILFLDINLPGMNGLKLAEAIQSRPNKPQVIFVTAYDNYALNAFSVGAADYLLKPINQASLNRAINKVIELRRGRGCPKSEFQKEKLKPPVLSADRRQQAADRILTEYNGRIILVDVDDICYAYSEGGKIYIKTKTQKLIYKCPLKELELKLKSDKFFRTHRSFIVNISKVKEIQPFFNGTWQLLLNDKENSLVPVSRNQVKKLRKLLG